MGQAMTLLQNREPVDEEEKKHLEEMKLPFLLNLSLTVPQTGETPEGPLLWSESAGHQPSEH